MERFNQIGDLVYKLPKTNIFNLDDIRARVEKSKSRIDMYKSKYGDRWQKEYIVGEGFYSEHNMSVDLYNMNSYISWGHYLNEPRWSELDTDAIAEYHKVLNDRLKVLFGSNYESIWVNRPPMGDRTFYDDDVNNKLLEDAVKTGKWRELPSYLRRKFCEKNDVPYFYKDIEIIDGDLHGYSCEVIKHIPRSDGSVLVNIVYRDNRLDAIHHAVESVYEYCHDFVDYDYLWLLRFSHLYENCGLSDMQFYENAYRYMLDLYKKYEDIDVFGRTVFDAVIDECNVNTFMTNKIAFKHLIKDLINGFVNWLPMGRRKAEEQLMFDLKDDFKGMPQFWLKHEDVFIPWGPERSGAISDEFRLYDRFYGIGWREWSYPGDPLKDVNGSMLNSRKFCARFTDGISLRQAIAYAHPIQDYRLQQFYGFDRYALDDYMLNDKRIVELLLLDAVNTGGWASLPDDMYYLYHKFIGVFDGSESFGY